MDDVRSKSTLPEQSDTDARTEEDLEQAVALSTGDLLRTSISTLNLCLANEFDRINISAEGELLLNSLVDKSSSGFTSRDSFKRILLTSLAQDIMYIVWRESEFVDDGALAEAGLGRQFRNNRKHLTRNSLKNAICDDRGRVTASASDALKRSIDRICDALEVFGLVERQFIRENLKPIEGTLRLHTLMLSAHTAVSHVFAKQLEPKEGVSDD